MNVWSYVSVLSGDVLRVESSGFDIIKLQDAEGLRKQIKDAFTGLEQKCLTVESNTRPLVALLWSPPPPQGNIHSFQLLALCLFTF